MIKVIRLLNAVTVDTTSPKVEISGAKKVTLAMEAASITSGNGVFSAEVQIGTVDNITYNKWIDNATNTNSQTLTRVASKTLSSNGVAMMSMSPEDNVEFISIAVDVTTDGAYTAYLLIDYGDNKK